LVNITEATVRDRIVSRLKELGLSTHEARAYTTLLTHPGVTASTLCKETNIPDSKLHKNRAKTLAKTFDQLTASL